MDYTIYAYPAISVSLLLRVKQEIIMEPEQDGKNLNGKCGSRSKSAVIKSNESKENLPMGLGEKSHNQRKNPQ